jgi:hypothetical protein
MLREEIKYVDDNMQMMTMWGEDLSGKEQKFMEVSMKRKM